MQRLIFYLFIILSSELMWGQNNTNQDIDKDGYIKKQLLSYQENLDRGTSYRTSTEPHALNLTLGYWYLAYEAVSDDVFCSIYPSAIELQAHVLEMIRDKYKHAGYLLSCRNFGEKNPSGVMLIRDENCKTLPGIEYVSPSGQWRTPNEFCDEDGNTCDYEVAKWAYVYTTRQEYRFTFEINNNNVLERINVPDEFYDENFKTRRLYN